MKFIDTHAHIYGDKYKDDFDDVIKRSKEELEALFLIGYDLESSKKSLEIAEKYDFIYAVIGYHPVDIKKITPEGLEYIEKMSSHKKVVAIGEIGLDYHWMEDSKEIQEKRFREQIELSKRVNLPIVIHTRDAMEDTIKIIEDYKDVKGILHCYPGSYETAQKVMDNYFFGVGGTVTFKNNKKTKEFVSKIPLEKIVIETDAPYLTPDPFRGKRNEPIYVKYVAEEIARIKEKTIEEVVEVTNQNAKLIYNIK